MVYRGEVKKGEERRERGGEGAAEWNEHIEHSTYPGVVVERSTNAKEGPS